MTKPSYVEGQTPVPIGQDWLLFRNPKADFSRYTGYKLCSVRPLPGKTKANFYLSWCCEQKSWEQESDYFDGESFYGPDASRLEREHPTVFDKVDAYLAELHHRKPNSNILGD